MNLSSTNLGSLQFAFYIIDATHMHIVEIDQMNYLAGDIYGAPSGSFSGASLAKSQLCFHCWR